jgi:predicted PurR-regulated permease PerM
MLNTQDKYVILIVSALVFAFIYNLSAVLSPFLAAALLAYLVNPLINKLMRLKISRLLSVIIVFLFLFSGLGLFFLKVVPYITSQIALFISSIPDMFSWAQTTMWPWVSDKIGIERDVVDIDALKLIVSQNMAKTGNLTGYFFRTIFHSGAVFVTWMINLLLIPVVVFYLLCDWPKIITKTRNLLPRRIEPTFVKLIRECDTVLGEFIRGQLLVMLALGVIYSVGLMLVGVKMGILIGMLAGLLSLVPYLGFIIGITAATIAALIQFGDLSHLSMVALVFMIGQGLEGAVLTPNLVGERVGLHPVVVIFAILAGGSIFGFVGVLLAVPVAAMTMVWLRFFTRTYRRSEVYKAE